MINNHKYTEQIALHEKCGLILEQINKYISYFNEAEDKLSRYDAAKPLDMIQCVNNRPDLVRNVELFQHFINRSFKFYQKHVDKINALIADLNKPTQEQRRRELLGKVVDLSKNTMYSMLNGFPLTKEFLKPINNPVLDYYRQEWGSLTEQERKYATMHLVEPIDYGTAELTSHIP